MHVQISYKSNCWLCHVCPSVRISTWNSTIPTAQGLWNLSTHPDFISARVVFIIEADCVVCQVLPTTEKTVDYLNIAVALCTRRKYLTVF